MEEDEDNASKDLIVYSNHKLGSIVEIYAGEGGTMEWIDKAKDKTECSKLGKEYEEKEQDGQGGVVYLDDDSDSEVEPLGSGDDEGDNSSNEDDGSSDDEETRAPSTNEKQHGHPVGKMIQQRK